MGSFETVLYSIGLVNTCYFYNALDLCRRNFSSLQRKVTSRVHTVRNEDVDRHLFVLW
jgi:hypothetical protein